MSESRIPDMSFTRAIARENGKIKDVFESTRFRLYNAGQFRHRLDGKNFSIKLPVRKSDREEFYLTMFMLRINDKWHSPGKAKYVFFTMAQILEIMTT